MVGQVRIEGDDCSLHELRHEARGQGKTWGACRSLRLINSGLWDPPLHQMRSQKTATGFLTETNHFLTGVNEEKALRWLWIHPFWSHHHRPWCRHSYFLCYRVHPGRSGLPSVARSHIFLTLLNVEKAKNAIQVYFYFSQFGGHT